MDFDTAIFRTLTAFSGKSTLLDLIAVFFAEYFGYILIIIALILVFRLPVSRARLSAIALCVLSTLLARGLLTELIRFFFPRLRPYVVFGLEPIIFETSASFPSGHMAFYGALAAVMFFLNRKIGLWFFGGVLLMGIARVFTLVHWPFDILGGIGIGILGALLARAIIGKLYHPGVPVASATPQQ